jgi:alpha-ketoglutarate-dependent taurine dioxygenase
MAESEPLAAARAATDLAALSIERVGMFCGAEITGIELDRPLDPAVVEAVAAAHAEHGVLVFPDQHLTSEQLMEFGRQFGELTVHPFSTNDAATPELIVFDNKEGNPPPPTDIWHSDETFRDCPAMGTILCAKIIPSPGGDTSFCSMTALYDGLSDRMQHYLSGLEAIHDFMPFKNLFPATEEGQARLRHFEERYPPIAHPVVRAHPVTGRGAIYVNRAFTTGIKGMDDEESRMILDFLYHRTLRHEYHYRHRWQPGTVVFWDNRAVQHSALHDYYPGRRKLDRITLRGDRPFGDVPPAEITELRRDLSPPLSDFGETRARRQNDA